VCDLGSAADALPAGAFDLRLGWPTAAAM